MSQYVNGCNCERCRTRGFMGPAILVTLGLLLLLGEFNVVRFHYTWPILLIVIGVVKVLQSNASSEGHIGGYIAYPGYPVATPPPPPTPAPDSHEGQVSNG